MKIRLILAGAMALAIAAPALAKTPYTYRYPVTPGYTSGMANTHGGGYPAADLIIKPRCGTAARSPVDGVVLEADRRNLWAQGFRGGAYRGGIFVSILGEDGVRYYMSHFASIPEAIKRGVTVTAGQTVGIVGRTGRAGSCHIHFGISPPCFRKGDWWIRRGVVWPQPYLRSWKKADIADLSPQARVARWLRANGCPATEADLP
ncbi:MAG TPA: M23 family metallopeptidase [Candidatus Limnocylindrales bacterium]|jgi:murein DD-endopeptidase MepM/ murein hydrolase activator NlpD